MLSLAFCPNSNNFSSLFTCDHLITHTNFTWQCRGIASHAGVVEVLGKGGRGERRGWDKDIEVSQVNTDLYHVTALTAGVPFCKKKKLALDGYQAVSYRSTYELFQIKSIREKYLTISLFDLIYKDLYYTHVYLSRFVETWASLGVFFFLACVQLESRISRSVSARDRTYHIFTILIVQNCISLESHWTLTWRGEKWDQWRLSQL